MRCPHCPDQTLQMTERQGIEIDYCPNCRGVWLDRGELDKLLDRAGQQTAPQVQAQPPQYQPQHQQQRYTHQQPHYKHKKSWLSEIFD